MSNHRLSVKQKRVNPEKSRQQNRKNFQNHVGNSDKKPKEPSLQEAASRLPKSRLIRTSSFNDINLCEHCEHGHAQKCCLYVYDDHSDIQRYANFKRDLDEPYWITNFSEDFDLNVGHSTPNNFPSYTRADPGITDHPVEETRRDQSFVLLRQYFWPVVISQSQQLSFDNQYPKVPGYPQAIMADDYRGSMSPHPFMPCIMNQIVVPCNHNDAFFEHQQVIESHSYVPVPLGSFW